LLVISVNVYTNYDQLNSQQIALTTSVSLEGNLHLTLGCCYAYGL